MGSCAQTWTLTGLTLHQREASSTACSEERQVLVLRLLSEGVGAKGTCTFPSFSPQWPYPNSAQMLTKVKEPSVLSQLDLNKACLSVLPCLLISAFVPLLPFSSARRLLFRALGRKISPKKNL